MEGTPCFTPVDRLDEWSFVWITAGVVILVYSLLHLFNVVSRHDENRFAHSASSSSVSFCERSAYALVDRRSVFGILDKAECRQFKTFQSLILSFPSFG
jgi:hypothetical protein